MFKIAEVCSQFYTPAFWCVITKAVINNKFSRFCRLQFSPQVYRSNKFPYIPFLRYKYLLSLYIGFGSANKVLTWALW